MTAAVAPQSLPQWLVDAVMGLVASAYQAGLAQGQAALAAPVAAVPAEDTLTRAEAARFLRMGLTKFDLLVRSGEVPTFKIGGSRYSRRADLQAWLDKQAEAA